MSSFPVSHARNAPFDAEIDRELMALAPCISEETFPALQDYRQFHPGEPDHEGRLGPEATRLSLHLARPRYNWIISKLRRRRGERGLDIGLCWGFADVVLHESYGIEMVGGEHPQNIPVYCRWVRSRGLRVEPWELGKMPCPFPPESFDFVIFSEVLEHLKLPPLRTLGEVLAPLKAGGTLILTTPNIARQSNIDALRRGDNILEPYREDVPDGTDVTDYVGHIREYTVAEVVDLVEAAGLRIEEMVMCNWMDEPLARNPLLNLYTCVLATKES